jgi:hypothetical protein
MEFLSEMWMPIVVSAVFVWIASSIIHMVLPHHKKEFAGHPDEEKLNAALEGVEPGQYMFPWGTMEDMKDPAYMEKQKKGPCGTLTIWPEPANFGRNLGMMLLFYLVVGVFVAYVASHSVAADAPYLTMFRITGACAFMAHGLGWIPGMVWFGQKGFWTYSFDSVIYALVTAGVFGWLA